MGITQFTDRRKPVLYLLPRSITLTFTMPRPRSRNDPNRYGSSNIEKVAFLFNLSDHFFFNRNTSIFLIHNENMHRERELKMVPLFVIPA